MGFDADLAGNLQFMDGSPFVFNNAENNVGGVKFASEQPNMLLTKSDGLNLICASDTYFNPLDQRCTRYPYTKHGISIVYYVENNVQHGHNMILETIIRSPMFLPGDFYQPQTRLQWSVDNA